MSLELHTLGDGTRVVIGRDGRGYTADEAVVYGLELLAAAARLTAEAGTPAARTVEHDERPGGGAR